MRLGTQARRGWPFRGAYQAFIVSVPLLRARLQYSSLPARKRPFTPRPLSSSRRCRFRVIRQPKGLTGPESICLLNTGTVHTFLIGLTWCPDIFTFIDPRCDSPRGFTDNPLCSALFRHLFRDGFVWTFVCQVLVSGETREFQLRCH